MEPRWLQAIFTANYLESQLDSEAKGTTGYAAVRPAHLLKAKIPLPPIEEQRRIVERIESLKSKVDEAALLNQQSVKMAEVLFYLEAKSIREDLLSREPARLISEIAAIRSGGTPDRSNPQFWLNGTIPWVKTGELCDQDIHHTEEKITPEAVAGSSAKLLPSETVLIAMYGQGQTRGRTAILRTAATTNQACAAILPQPDLFTAKYLQYWLRSLYHEMRAETRAGAQPNWNAGMVGQIRIVTPPIEIQRQVVRRLETIEEHTNLLRKRQHDTEVELRALLPSVLSHAFSGQL